MNRRRLEFIAWCSILLFLAAVAVYTSTRPLPGDLDRLVVSDPLMRYLQEANR